MSMKDRILHRIKQESAAIAPDFLPKFYDRVHAELAFAKESFFIHPLVTRCREDVLPFLYDDFGHGIDHAKKVAIEACALVMHETLPQGIEVARRLGLLAMLAGLLHDSCRLEDNHAVHGAELSRLIFQDYPLDDAEKDIIYQAIASHEAFSSAPTFANPYGQFVADALYDADKFRWGPDNFNTTLWEICDYQEWTLEQILEKFPVGLEIIVSITNTFRTQSGKIYGPEFIELGLVMGKKIYQIIQKCSQHDGCLSQTWS